MAKQLTDTEAIAKMKNIKASTNILEIKSGTKKSPAKITMQIDNETATELMNQYFGEVKKYAILYILDKEEFDKLKDGK